LQYSQLRKKAIVIQPAEPYRAKDNRSFQISVMSIFNIFGIAREAVVHTDNPTEELTWS